ICRSGWIADFPDAMAFLNLFRNEGSANDSGWSNDRYKQLLTAAENELDPDDRLTTLAKAEELLLKEAPVIPLFYYTAPYLLDSRISGFYPNALDLHPFKSIFIKGSFTAALGLRAPLP